MKNFNIVALVLWGLMVLLNPIKAQTPCNFRTGEPVNFAVVGSTAGQTNYYVLTDTTGIIRYVSQTMPINGVAAGAYKAYSIVHESAGTPPSVSVGTNVANMGGTACTAVSQPFSIGVCNCSNTTGSVNFQTINNSTGGSISQTYVVTDGKYKIISTTNTPSVSGLSTGIYNLFSVVFDNTQSPAPSFTAGASISDIGGICKAVSAPLGFVVCSTDTFDLALVKKVITPTDGQVDDNTPVKFAITVYNQGNQNAFDIKIKDYAPADLQYSTADNTAAATGNTANWAADTTYTIPSLAAGDSATIYLFLKVVVTTNTIEPQYFINRAEISFATKTAGNTVNATDIDSQANAVESDDAVGGDDKIKNENDDEDDHDFAFVNYRGKFDPSGYIYCDKSGRIIKGGAIAVQCPASGIAYIVKDGSDGQFMFFTNNVAGVYTMTYAHPNGFPMSTTCTPQSGTFDPTGLDGTAIDRDGLVNGTIDLGQTVNNDSTYLSNFTCTANPFYTRFNLNAGDPFIFLNNLPIQCAVIAGRVKVDANGNNTFDNGDVSLQNVVVRLYDDATPANLIHSTTTNAAGKYVFDNIYEGDYRVQFVAPSGYTYATANVGNDDDDSDVTTTGGFTDEIEIGWGECDTTVSALLKLAPNPINLRLSKTVDSMSVSVAGQTVNFTLKVKNTSATNATGVKVKVNAGSGFTFVSATPSVNYVAGTGIWTVGAVNAGDSATLTLTVRADSVGINYCTAEIDTADQIDANSTPRNGVTTEDDIARACVSVPMPICLAVGYTATLPNGLTGIQWFKNGVAISGANGQSLNITAVGDYTFNANETTCPVEGCCPIKIVAGNCPQSCKPMICLPVTVMRN